MKIFNWLGLSLIVVLLSSCEGIKLTVESGSGSGNYASKSTVPIKAHMPSPGYEFDRWEGETQYIEDVASNETYVLLPELSGKEALEIKVKAVYEVDPSAKEYNLVVEDGSGSGSYLTYSVVTIKANNPSSGYQFDKWVGDVEYVYNPNLSSVKIIIQKDDISLKATYKEKIISTPIPTPISTFAPGQIIKLMPIGDSITHASKTTGDVRCQLWDRLQALSWTFDFVGQMYGLVGGGATSNCDNNHEARAGWRAEQVLQIIGASASKYKPDMATIHLGTNDLSAGQSNDSTVNEISQIIDQLRTYNVKVVVFVAGIIPNYLSNNHSETKDLNAKILKMVSTKSNSVSPIIYVDQFTGFVPEDLADKLHPNDAGSAKMATKWAQAIENYLP